MVFYSNNTFIRLTLPFSFNSALIQRVSHFVLRRVFFLQYLSVNFKWKLMTLNYSKNSILKYSSCRHYLVFIWQECILSELPDQLSWFLHSTLQAYTYSARCSWIVSGWNVTQLAYYHACKGSSKRMPLKPGVYF